MEKVIAVLTEKEYGRIEVKFECTGDVWKWFNKNKKKSLAYDIMQDVIDSNVHEFMYDVPAEKFLKKYQDLVTVVK